MFNFLKGKTPTTIDKEEIAKLLSTNKEALEEFERAYAFHALNEKELSDNFFEINSRQAAAMKSHCQSVDSPQLDEIKTRIVNELLNECSTWKFDGQKATINNNLGNKVITPVTNEELSALPKEIRPQLTGNLMKVDIISPSHIAILENYKNFLNEKNPKKRKFFYNMFRQGLDILDLDEITRRIISTNRNSMGYWLPNIVEPAIENGQLKIPKTTIVKVPTTMLQLTRCEYMELTRSTLDIVDEFCRQAFELDENKDYFIKTGVYSSKFDFRNAHVFSPKEVREIGEYLLFIHYQALQMASPLTRPSIYGVSTTDEWVVREYIKDVENNPTIYKGLPLHTEYRVFVDFDTKEIIGMSPYWEPNTMKQRFGHKNDSNSPHNIHDYTIYAMHEPILMKRYEENKQKVKDYVQNLINSTDKLNGQWAIDIMQNGDDLWLIDMSIAENSALYNCVPKSLRKKSEENWLPTLK
ncbi:MAG: hypothetical protein K2I70_01535 [Bacilli bacterium]|nr:hypothetical protein [Bacilli bacterium]